MRPMTDILMTFPLLTHKSVTFMLQSEIRFGWHVQEYKTSLIYFAGMGRNGIYGTSKFTNFVLNYTRAHEFIYWLWFIQFQTCFSNILVHLSKSSEDTLYVLKSQMRQINKEIFRYLCYFLLKKKVWWVQK